jgi:hypothetical protein
MTLVSLTGLGMYGWGLIPGQEKGVLSHNMNTLSLIQLNARSKSGLCDATCHILILKSLFFLMPSCLYYSPL